MNSWLKRLLSGNITLQQIQLDFFQEDREPTQEKVIAGRTKYLTYLKTATPAELQTEKTLLDSLVNRTFSGYEEGGSPSALQWWKCALDETLEIRHIKLI